MDKLDGYLLIDKPQGWTSHDVVNKVRSLARAQSEKKRLKVGHAGTLDPMATGLLIVLIGSTTKRQNSFMKLDKLYDAQITLGTTTTTDDAEGEVIQKRSESVTESEVMTVLDECVGSQHQIPPQFSAIKIHGQPAYKHARSGQVLQLAPRSVTIFSISDIAYTWPQLSFRVHVSSGTYIRSLARDIGQKLGCGAHLSGLRRLQIGSFNVAQAVSSDKLTIQTITRHLHTLDTQR